MAVKRFLSDLLTPARLRRRCQALLGTSWGGHSVITVSKETAVAAVPLTAAVQRVSARGRL